MLSKSNKNKEQRTKSKPTSDSSMLYRDSTVIGLKNPACSLHAPFSDVQDANEMRTVEDATQDVRQIRQIRPIGLIGGWRDRKDRKPTPSPSLKGGEDRWAMSKEEQKKRLIND